MDFGLIKRDNVLREALANNLIETQRWEKFKEDNIQALENMKMFIKKIQVEILVPVGNKALLPGYLYHTNEVLTGHYNGLFSKCTVSQAEEIVKYRTKLAKERLESLSKEREMFQNKLELPHKDGVLPEEGQQEIIEEYDEEKEKQWKEAHKKRLREHKQKEREERLQQKENTATDEKSLEDVTELLDHLELIEELDNELEKLEIDDSETFAKLMSGEIELPKEKHRISHAVDKINPKSFGVILGENENKKDLTTEEKSNSELQLFYKNYKDAKLSEFDIDKFNNFTNNNSIPNIQDFSQSNGNDNQEDSDGESDFDSDEYFEEFNEIERQIKNFSPMDKIKFYKTKFKEIQSNLNNFEIRNVEDMDQKVTLLELRDCILDRIDILKDEINNYDENNFVSHKNDELEVKNSDTTNKNGKKLKKRISFALEDQIQYIDENESVDMMKNSNQKQNKDIIFLDSNDYQPRNDQNYEENPTNKILDRKQFILNQVEKSYNFVSDNQSQQEFNLVEKILSSDSSKTLHIEFTNSKNASYKSDFETDQDRKLIVGNPSDIYKLYLQEISSESGNDLPVKIFEQTKEIVENVETKIQVASRSQDNQLNSKQNSQGILNMNQHKPETKSILKNKSSVELENHHKVLEEKEMKNKKTKKSKNKKDDFMCYEMIVGDVIEKPSTKPDPLPDGNYVDAHAPKKRISRFKQIRGSTVAVE